MTFERFTALHHGQEPLLLPNAWDHASAAALAAAGFAAVGTTSLGVAAAAGRPDAEGATRAETLALARAIAPLPVPVTVDIEGGFGGSPEQVAELARELAAMGVAGINLEDGRGARLADTAEQTVLISMIKNRVPELFVNARTDPFWLGEPDALATAVRRIKAYVDAGADGVFVPGATAPRDLQTLAAAGDVPLNVLVQPGVPLERLAALGVRRVSYGSLLFRAALGAAVDMALQVARGQAVSGDVPSYERVQRLAGDSRSR
ncbi:isocitrate lyase/PEP mutase family protein [Streptosporangium sp. NBC_01756]|uniref:isocitrate lyase/PEP mutase family protein n=1 Tax=Streptosporangium sp. NBC_01756 TaxID=2975950 RepID=UPI002DD8F1DB|nr:isocitrate lyase/phosphoenolpyruvate mutase family protein [Streptosporangium sp. NBC_01756]WSC87849.1 isocitrate lyase/phosphoenolpyruvate mutase family protein [Streptosporangium sp. NBC_01756]